ncbi:hypothetical protein CCH79_00001035, partial [Gambusia affinis]
VPLGMDLTSDSKMTSEGDDGRPVPPTSLPLQGGPSQRKKLSAPQISFSLDHSEDDLGETPDDLDIDVDELDTPDEGDYFDYTDHEMDWEDPGAATKSGTGDSYNTIPTYSAEEERRDVKLWRTVVIGEQEQRINMKVIEPYMKVISHGGYYGSGVNAIIVFAACFLPDSAREDYHDIMENLFLYVISTLELMVAEDYMIVYLNGATPHRRMPGLGWLKKCYQMIDRRLRKNLKSFIIVHPSWFIRTVLAITKPFISTKFSSKIKYVSSLDELRELIPMDSIQIPECIIKLDKDLKEAAENSNKINEPVLIAPDKTRPVPAARKPEHPELMGCLKSNCNERVVLVVIPQLSVPKLSVHRAILAHVNNVLVVVLVVVIIPFPRATLTDVDELSLLEAASGRGRGGGVAAGVYVAASEPSAGTELLVPAGREVRGAAFGTGVPDEENDTDESQDQQDGGDDEDSHVPSRLLFLFIPECQLTSSLGAVTTVLLWRFRVLPFLIMGATRQTTPACFQDRLSRTGSAVERTWPPTLLAGVVAVFTRGVRFLLRDRGG